MKCRSLLAGLATLPLIGGLFSRWAVPSVMAEEPSKEDKIHHCHVGLNPDSKGHYEWGGMKYCSESEIESLRKQGWRVRKLGSDYHYQGESFLDRIGKVVDSL